MVNADAISQLGRPRGFCVEAALRAALGVFRARGYAGASMSELTAAMGIHRPSLYAAFGNKEALFRRALDLYMRERRDAMTRALTAPTARGVAEGFLHGLLDGQVDADGGRGCVALNQSVACGPEAEAVRAEVLLRGAAMEAALLERFERARQEGDLPSGFEPAALVRLLIAVGQGMGVQAGAGAAREELEQLVATTLRIWPGR